MHRPPGKKYDVGSPQNAHVVRVARDPSATADLTLGLRDECTRAIVRIETTQATLMVPNEDAQQAGGNEDAGKRKKRRSHNVSHQEKGRLSALPLRCRLGDRSVTSGLITCRRRRLGRLDLLRRERSGQDQTRHLGFAQLGEGERGTLKVHHERLNGRVLLDIHLCCPFPCSL